MTVARSGTIAATIRARIENGKRDRFWTPSDFHGLGDPAQVDRVLSWLASRDDLRKVRRGLYWRGRATPFGMSRPDTIQVAMAVAGGRGVGPAGLSAANDLGLTSQVPAIELVAVPRRAPRPLPTVRFLDRAGRTGRATAGLNTTEVALLEVLGDWNRLVELDDHSASRRLVDLISAGAVRIDHLVKAGQGEPAATRERLRAVLRAAGENEAAERVPPARTSKRRAGVAA